MLGEIERAISLIFVLDSTALYSLMGIPSSLSTPRHLTMMSKDGVSKERIDYEKPFSNCSKELATQKSHIKKNYKSNQIKN